MIQTILQLKVSEKVADQKVPGGSGRLEWNHGLVSLGTRGNACICRLSQAVGRETSIGGSQGEGQRRSQT